MKNHIIFKFIAVVLCAACLLTAVGSGIGALCLTEMGLYEQTVDDLYDESRNTLAEVFASQIAQHYASQTLGGCPEEMTNNYVNFNAGYYGYILRDANGNVLKERALDEHSAAWSYAFQVQGQYQKLIESIPESEMYDTEEPTITGDREHYVYDAVPPEGAGVSRITVTFSSGENEEVGSSEPLGLISYREDGAIFFIGLDTNYFLSHSGPVSQVTFYGTSDEVLFEASADMGEAIGLFYENEANNVCFQFLETSPEVLPATSVPVTIPDATTVVMEMPTEIPTEVPTEAPTEVPTEPEVTTTVITDNIDRLGSQVARITVTDGEGNVESLDYGVDQGQAFGYLYRNDDGTVTFKSYDSITVFAIPEGILKISFLSGDGNLLYQVTAPEGVGEFSRDNNGCMIFTTTVTLADVDAAAEPEPAATETTPAEPAATEPMVTEPITIPDTTTATAEVETPVGLPDEAKIIAEVTDPTEGSDVSQNAGYSPDDIFSTYYYDSEQGQHVRAEFVYEDMPEAYTVELFLAPGAYEMDAVYDLLQLVWEYRNELLYVLGISLFFFAVFAVYLCCSAGRKPGQEEIRAGGLNCLSLDVYLGVGGLAICALAVLGFEGGYYLLRNSPHILAPFVIIMGYTAALIIVGFCFACAAQFKTPGGYWWRNTLCARLIMGCGHLALWLEKLLGTRFFPFIGRCIKFCWRNGKRVFLAAFRYTEKLLTWSVGFAARCVKFLWKHGSHLAVVIFHGTEKGLTWLVHFLGKCFRRIFAWLHRFLSLLPVTWQWLLIGLFLLFVLFLSILTRSEGFMVLGVIAGIALVVYGSHCFGILWESTRNMSKGDLETKVDDKLMVGSFKEFAGDLNALADVAVIAAQKQLKSERMKTELITNVSHDIKTPLTSIINYVDLLQKPHSEEEQEVYLEVLSRQSQQMKKLLEDLIEMSKASTGNMAVYITKLDAREAVSQALGEFSDKLEKAQLTAVVRQPEEPVYMQADGRLVWRVLSNVLSNTVKYALPGTRVYIDLMEMEDKVIISMKNISREELNVSADELMERFVRGDTSRNTEGSGLGLNIAQSLMEIQKGKLQLLVDGDLFKVTLVFPGTEE